MPVRAMVDVAAAASPRPYPDRQLALCRRGPAPRDRHAAEQDARSHRARRAAASSRHRPRGDHDLFAKRIAEIFVLATRFDPLHRADCEQSLYDRLPRVARAAPGRARSPSSRCRTRARNSESTSSATSCSASPAASTGLVHSSPKPASRGRAWSCKCPTGSRVAGPAPGAWRVSTTPSSSLSSMATRRARRSCASTRSARSTGRSASCGIWLGARAGRARARRIARVRAARSMPPVNGARHAHRPSRDRLSRRRGRLVVGRDASPQRRTTRLDDESGGVSRAHCEIVLRDGELRLRDLSSLRHVRQREARRRRGHLASQPT